MVVRLHPKAIAEYVEANSFYEDRPTGLGREFFDEGQRVLSVMRDSQAQVARSRLRRVRADVFRLARATGSTDSRRASGRPVP